ncbi:hypothetical protein RND71_040833 [Anisodus tanguticus]|uniref:Uncharacterized protein n=1 Tax=Anisodus tanguticus TaxID=243964 RepID=A0AAE1UTQ3_9SOLA|nr:hypothetical protein RND71_040833 [Anisodus tanguticus]
MLEHASSLQPTIGSSGDVEPSVLHTRGDNCSESTLLPIDTSTYPSSPSLSEECPDEYVNGGSRSKPRREIPLFIFSDELLAITISDELFAVSIAISGELVAVVISGELLAISFSDELIEFSGEMTASNEKYQTVLPLSLHKNTCAVEFLQQIKAVVIKKCLLELYASCKSLEKLMDVTKEELPDTMAAVRLCATEISYLTMELIDTGQGLTQGVRSSTRVVRLAEERL